MAPTQQELSLLIEPMVSENIAHNFKLLSNLHSLASFLLGFAAGILGLQSIYGFAFYLCGAVIVSCLFHTLLISVVKNEKTSGLGAGAYFPGNGEVERIDVDGKTVVTRRVGAWRDVWVGGMGQAVSGFILGWAGVAGLLR